MIRCHFFCCITITIACAISFSATAGAQDRPLSGFLYNESEPNSLTYDCKKTNPGEIQCDFVQVHVTKKANPEDLSKALKQARESFKTLKPKDECMPDKDSDAMISALEGRSPPPDPVGFSKMSPRQRQDALEDLRAMATFCKAPSLDKFLDFVTRGERRKQRTCRVWTNTFQQTLHLQTPIVGRGPKTWTVISTPSGDCGVVQLDRFEEEKTDEKLKFYNYYARKAVTNPNATSLFGLKCSELDEREYKFSWKSQELDLGCDYVEFGP